MSQISVIEKGKIDWILYNYGVLKKNALNKLIVPYTLGHCNLFCHKSLLNVLYNNHDELYISRDFVVSMSSILLNISGFNMFLQNKVFSSII